MPDSQQPDVIDVAGETVVLGIKLVGKEIESLPTRVAEALEKPAVQQAIFDALKSFAQSHLSRTPVTLSAQDSQALITAMANGGANAVKQDVIQQIKGSSRYKAVDQSLKDLAADFKKSPLGAWLDREKKWIYIVAAGAVVGGVAAMYLTRKGDLVGTRLLPLLGRQSITFQPIGELHLEVGFDHAAYSFEKHQGSVTTFATANWKTAKWEAVQAEVNVTATQVDSKLTLAAEGKVVIPLKAQGMNLSASGSYHSGNNNWALGVSLEVDVAKHIQLGVFGGVGNPTIGPLPGGDAFRGMPQLLPDHSSPHGFGAIGLSARF
jgi:hypothetical protein